MGTTIQTLETIIQSAQTFHNRLAQVLYPRGGILRCDQCGHTHAFTTDDAAHYLRAGWLQHCGCTMCALTTPDAGE